MLLFKISITDNAPAISENYFQNTEYVESFCNVYIILFIVIVVNGFFISNQIQNFTFTIYPKLVN